MCDPYHVALGMGMNGDDADRMLVTAVLPDGMPFRVKVAGSGSSDGIAGVGIRDLDLREALDRVGEIGSLVVEKLTVVRSAKATFERRLGFAVEAGRLTAFRVGGKGEASSR